MKKVRSFSAHHWGLVTETPQAFYKEVVVWRRLRHPNIVPCLGVPTGKPQQYKIVCSWMENGRITDYVKKSPQADRIDLVSEFESSL